MSDPSAWTVPGGSRKAQALAYISDYIVREGRSPAIGEIACALEVSPTRAKALVKTLAAEKMIERAPGAQRGITVPGLMDRHLVQRLRSLGFVVDDDFTRVDHVMALPQGHLSLVAIIDHIPDVVAADDTGDLHATSND